jgi:hypothetical protein
MILLCFLLTIQKMKSASLVKDVDAFQSNFLPLPRCFGCIYPIEVLLEGLYSNIDLYLCLNQMFGWHVLEICCH